MFKDFMRLHTEFLLLSFELGFALDFLPWFSSVIWFLLGLQKAGLECYLRSILL